MPRSEERPFGNVQENFSWFIDAYSNIAVWKATCDRLLSFRQAMLDNEERAAAIDVQNQGDTLQVSNLNLDLADGRHLLTGASMSVAAGERLILSGRSGSGKSTLLRAMGKLWLRGAGSIRLPAAQTCRLPHLADRLDESNHWQRMLSPGEQQRLAFAPQWLFLDEATAAMDEEDEAALYQALIDQIPGLSIVSVGHRSSLNKFHPRHLRIEQGHLVTQQPVGA